MGTNRIGFSDICDKKYTIIYKTHSELKNKIPLEDCKFAKVTGVLENFTTKEVVINSEKDGFMILPFISIIYMFEEK